MVMEDASEWVGVDIYRGIINLEFLVQTDLKQRRRSIL
jgi:hypothetical protein